MGSSLRDFSLVTELARSAQGSVWKARRRRPSRARLTSKDPVAESDGALISLPFVVLKERRNAELGPGKNVLNELELLQRVRHPHVVRLLSHFRDKGDVLYMELEFAESGDLGQVLGARREAGAPLAQAQARAAMRHVAAGVACLHSQRIVHRDIKAANVFVVFSSNAALGIVGLVLGAPERGAVLKIGDLGVGRFCSQQTMQLKSGYGTPLYMSPEICENLPYDYSTDLWSAGVLFYETLCNGEHPFTGRSIVALSTAICKGAFEPLPDTVPTDLRRVVDGLLQLKAKERMPLTQVLEALEETEETMVAVVTNEGKGGEEGEKEEEEEEEEEEKDEEEEERGEAEQEAKKVEAEEPGLARKSRLRTRREEIELRRKRNRLKALEAWCAQADEFGQELDKNVQLRDQLRNEIKVEEACPAPATTTTTKKKKKKKEKKEKKEKKRAGATTTRPAGAGKTCPAIVSARQERPEPLASLDYVARMHERSARLALRLKQQHERLLHHNSQ